MRIGLSCAVLLSGLGLSALLWLGAASAQPTPDETIQTLIAAGRLDTQGTPEKLPPFGTLKPVPPTLSNEEWWRWMSAIFCENEPGWDATFCGEDWGML